jgi:hypothetical protein
LRAGGTPWTLFNIDVGTDVPVRAAPVAEGIPEPVSWALMITGFALVGAALRRRTPHAA